MGIRFNADEAFAMACEIERNGRRFYERGADLVGDEASKKLLGELAEWEAGHEKLFAAMRAELSDDEKTSTAFDPEGEAELYLEAMADAHVFVVDGAVADAAAALDADDTPADVIGKALEFERDSILFVLGLKHMVPKRLGPGKVEEIVKEEIGHVAYLQKAIARLGGA